MHRTKIAALAVLLLAQSLAHADKVFSLQGSGELLPDTPNQQLTVLLSGGIGSFSYSTMHLKINGGVGPAPYVTAVFDEEVGGYFTGDGHPDFANSIWADGSFSVIGTWNHPHELSDGLTVISPFFTAGAVPVERFGVYATLTISTVGVPAGSYQLSLAESDLVYINPPWEMDEAFHALTGTEFTLTVVPEPSTCSLAAIGVLGLLARGRRNLLRRRQKVH